MPDFKTQTQTARPTRSRGPTQHAEAVEAGQNDDAERRQTRDTSERSAV